MAFPTVAASNTSVQSSATNSHTISLPSGIQAGDLLIIFFTYPISGLANALSGWTKLKEYYGSGDVFGTNVYYRVADGTEGSTVTITTTGNFQSAHASYRITGHGGNPEVSTGATSTGSTTPDPDSLTPSGGAKDYLWIAHAGAPGAVTFSAYPTNYGSNQLTIRSNTSGNTATVAVATRNLNASSEDPGTFTISGSVRWVALTIAVPPVASTAHTKTLTESATITDVLRKAPTRNLSESLTMTANLIKSAVRTLTESVTITDVLTRIRIQTKELVESFTVSDSIIRTATRILTESATITDTLRKTFQRTLTESVTITDSILKTISRFLSETLAVTDSLIKSLGRTLFESLTVTAALIKGTTKLLTEATAITDSIVRGITKVFTETLSIVDTVRKYLNGLLAIYSNKYSSRGTSYGNKYSSRGTSYTDKYNRL